MISKRTKERHTEKKTEESTADEINTGKSNNGEINAGGSGTGDGSQNNSDIKVKDVEKQIRSLKRQKFVFKIIIAVLAVTLIGGIYFIHQRRRAYDIRVAQLETRDNETKSMLKEYQEREASGGSSGSESGDTEDSEEASGETAGQETEGADMSAGAEASDGPSSSEEADPDTDGTDETSEENDKTRTGSGNVSLCMVGDLLMHSPVNESGKQQDGTYDYSGLFSHVKNKIQHVDAAFINQETLLAGEGYQITSYPKFNGRSEVKDAIASAGFDVVLHANNHTLDRGTDGLYTDLSQWKKVHPEIKVTGAYMNKRDSQKITIIRRRGIKIAVLNYTYGTNGGSLPAESSYMVNILSKEKVRHDVQAARKKADFIIVFPHWGTEYKTEPDAGENRWCRYFLSLGVDLVVGSHPHVIQPVKWMRDRSGHKMLVYYSLGNFINSSTAKKSGTYRQYCGGMANVILRRNREGKVYIRLAKFYPLITDYPPDGKITAYFIGQYDQTKASESRLSSYDSTFSYSACRRLFSDIIDRRFLSGM